jgi:mannose-6-phosphate isomerase-like protein (cupin superfamily)
MVFVLNTQLKFRLKGGRIVPSILPQEGKSAMHSVKGVIAGLVLLLGFSPTPARTQVLNRTLAVDRTKQAMAATAVKANRVNAASFRGAGTPAASSSSSATYFDKEKVAAGFAKGNPSVLFQGAGFPTAKGGGSNFEVHTSRHDGSAVPEVHTLDTDIYYVVEGTATYVTGGTLVNPKTIAPNQIRGTDIEGGETRQLSKGEVLVIPNGVPHWFKEVRGQFLYLVVKIR